MRKILVLVFILFTLNSCMSVREIGTLNMISTRNVSLNEKYELLATYVGISKNELKRSKSQTINEATNTTVKRVPGGEFLMNAKIYIINERSFAVEGDIWGLKTNAKSYRGFEIGDRVMWKVGPKIYKGVLKGHISEKNTNICIIERENGKIAKVKYDNITKLE